MNVAEQLVLTLVANDVRQVFMLTGTASIYLDAAVTEHPGIDVVCARHETAAALMAVGYAKASGRTAAVLVTSGPAAVNALAGLVDAYADGGRLAAERGVGAVMVVEVQLLAQGTAPALVDTRGVG